MPYFASLLSKFEPGPISPILPSRPLDPRSKRCGWGRPPLDQFLAFLSAQQDKKLTRQMLWFLAPTVALCNQQYQNIRLQVPIVSIRLLTGNEKVDTWHKASWETILQESRIIVSTPQVLKEALDHSFLQISKLALIVVDEGMRLEMVGTRILRLIAAAHNAVGRSALSKIMGDFYHPCKKSGRPVPSILGLTATPSMRSLQNQLENLEATLDAQCVTPTVHRETFFRHVNKPQIYHVSYFSPAGAPRQTKLMVRLQQAHREVNISHDPYVLKLKRNISQRKRETFYVENHEILQQRDVKLLRKAIVESATWSQKQFRQLNQRAERIHAELGAWAADRYIHMCAHPVTLSSSVADPTMDVAWFDERKRYVRRILESVQWEPPNENPVHEGDVSEKAHILIQELMNAGDAPIGIIFVKERVMVDMLREVLLSNAAIREKYKITTMVGSSSSIGRSSDLFEFRHRHDLEALQDFAANRCNLLIATNVLEEGIDVPACNLIICFNMPETTTSFMQRRGRARMRESKLILFYEQTDRARKDWDAAEAAMRQLYEDEERSIRKLQELEWSDDPGHLTYTVEETGARLDMENAKQYLARFCQYASRGEFIDSNPDYIPVNDQSGKLRARVLLPSSLPRALRSAESAHVWTSEKNATKDAALQAYKALHRAGLVDENLLPIPAGDKISAVETRQAIVEVDAPIEAWKKVVTEWLHPSAFWRYPLMYVDEHSDVYGEYALLLPVRVQPPRPITIYLERNVRHVIRIRSSEKLDTMNLDKIPDHTSTLLALHYQHRWAIEKRSHLVRIHAVGAEMSMNQLGDRHFEMSDTEIVSGNYLVRNREGNPFILHGILPMKPAAEEVSDRFWGYEHAPDDISYLALKKWTRRSDFLHNVGCDDSQKSITSKQYQCVLPVTEAVVDTIPLRHARFGMLIPSIIHEFEVMLIAKDLLETILAGIHIPELALVREAISSRSAAEPVDYERLEFLGDSILKFCATVQVSADRKPKKVSPYMTYKLMCALDPTWPEGFLTFSKDRLIANARLSRAAQETGLARYILTKPFTGQKWRPTYLTDAIGATQETSSARLLSTKVLADVVEALIGASFVSGGLGAALQCIQIFIKEVEWQETEANRNVLLSCIETGLKNESIFGPVQGLIGYSFTNTSLLFEALTHASYMSDSTSRSLERLEFLGDAILDYIIVTKLFAVSPPLSHSQMHMHKTAMVNGDFLAFMAFERSHRVVQHMPNEEGDLEPQVTDQPLCMFMRHESAAVSLERITASRKHAAMREDVNAAIRSGSHYPWASLARLQAKKCFSDIVESLLAAVWVDSGDMANCERMLYHLGILPYLDRILSDGVHVQHPKEELSKAAFSEKVEYEIDVKTHPDTDVEYLCRIYLGDRIIADVDGGVNKEEIKTKAATVALQSLEREKWHTQK